MCWAMYVVFTTHTHTHTHTHILCKSKAWKLAIGKLEGNTSLARPRHGICRLYEMYLTQTAHEEDAFHSQADPNTG
jgi:hypothetical protein